MNGRSQGAALLTPTFCRIAACTAAASLAWLAAASTVAQSQAPSFRAGVVLVPVDVRAIDANANPVTDLAAADFTIFDDGVPQKTALFSAQAQVESSRRGRAFFIFAGAGRFEPTGEKA